jgi:TonB dependent receptor
MPGLSLRSSRLPCSIACSMPSFGFGATSSGLVFGGGANVPGFPSVTPTRAQQAVLSNTKAFSPTAVNEARVSFMRTSTTTDKPQAGFAKLSDLGFFTGADTLGIVYSGPPGFEGVGPISFNTFSIGNPFITTGQPNNTWHFSDAFSKIAGRHTFKFGGEYRYQQINERNVCAPNGSFNFDGSETGVDFADYLLGAPSGYTQCSMQFLDSRARYGAAYFQDSFRLKPNVTLNYGLRWEAATPWYDTQNKIETIVPGLQSTVFPTAPKGWVVPGDPGVPPTLAPARYNNFGPRIGLAYSPGFSEGVLGFRQRPATMNAGIVDRVVVRAYPESLHRGGRNTHGTRRSNRRIRSAPSVAGSEVIAAQQWTAGRLRARPKFRWTLGYPPLQGTAGCECIASGIKERARAPVLANLNFRCSLTAPQSRLSCGRRKRG